jgi:hypothetical protein
MPPEPVALEAPPRITLVETLDRLLHKGAVIAGDLTLSVADVDLIFVGLRLIVASVETAQSLGGTGERRGAPRAGGCGPAPGRDGPLLRGSATVGEAAWARDEPIPESRAHPGPVPRAAPASRAGGPEAMERGLARLVLAVGDLLRRLMERQALRRVEGGSLRPDEVERMGLTFLRLEESMEELKAHFGLTDRDLALDLGPLGDLL